MCHRAFGGQPLVNCPLNFSVLFHLFNFFFLKDQEVGHRKSDAASEAQSDSCCCFRHHNPQQRLQVSAGQEFPPLLLLCSAGGIIYTSADPPRQDGLRAREGFC